jgi:phenazine biosynthesis protein phzE
MSTPQVFAAAALERVTGQQAWAVIRLRDSDTVTLVGGPLIAADRLADVPIGEGVPEPGRRFDTLVAVPFRQVAERGFDVHDDGSRRSSRSRSPS